MFENAVYKRLFCPSVWVSRRLQDCLNFTLLRYVIDPENSRFF